MSDALTLALPKGRVLDEAVALFAKAGIDLSPLTQKTRRLVFDFPDLRVLVSEGGATWGPFIADRMDEGYRQHGAAVRPTLSKLPSQYLYDQVYASFQHDASAVAASSAMGWKNVMWGSDYPHFEGTFGHTQKTLHELFDGVNDEISRRIRIGAFQELFPHVPALPHS